MTKTILTKKCGRCRVKLQPPLRHGVASFDLVRHHRANESVFLYAFDLIELNGDDLRRDPLKVRKAVCLHVRLHRLIVLGDVTRFAKCHPLVRGASHY
jgi:hypothetical protein